uniref:Uncharacterized protein n=2 Tax=Eucampia antarctica TaxID=49252 RepID=A0A7S2RSH9_9STRA|mmetsp:Transcript_26223/g.25072  ORF Transcript_26223/g.25072 Transcript_26223/m.25072 type:complete len:263 (+) Transcript_26223:211-999(+)
MMNRFLKLVLILSGVASGYLCDAHMMEINNKREMKSIKGLNSLIETDNAGTKAPKKEKGPDQMKGPSVLGKVNDSKGPKTKKRKSKSASYAATFTSSLVIDSSKGTTADDFDKDTTAQDIVGEALKQGLALTSKSHKSPKSNSRKIATYVNSVSFDKASEAISGTTISRVHYNFQALTSDPENAASTVQAEIDSLAAAGTLTDIFNELDTTNTYGFMAASSNVAKVAYRVTVSVGYECTQSIGDGDGVPKALHITITVLILI